MDYAIMMIKAEQALKRMHQDCLKKQWSTAQMEVDIVMAKMLGLKLWLGKQEDGKEGKFEVPPSQ